MSTMHDVMAAIAGRTDSNTELLMALTMEKIDNLKGMSVSSITFDKDLNALQANLHVELPNARQPLPKVAVPEMQGS